MRRCLWFSCSCICIDASGTFFSFVCVCVWLLSCVGAPAWRRWRQHGPGPLPVDAPGLQATATRMNGEGPGEYWLPQKAMAHHGPCLQPLPHAHGVSRRMLGLLDPDKSKIHHIRQVPMTKARSIIRCTHQIIFACNVSSQ